MIFLYLIFYILYLIYNKIWQSNLIKIKIQHHLLKKRLSKIIQKMALNLIFILSLKNYSIIQKMNLRVNLYSLSFFHYLSICVLFGYSKNSPYSLIFNLFFSISLLSFFVYNVVRILIKSLL